MSFSRSLTSLALLPLLTVIAQAGPEITVEGPSGNLAANTVQSFWTNSGFTVTDYGQTVVPAGLTSVQAVAAGGSQGLALRTDGTVAVWGGMRANMRTLPPGLGNVGAIAAGDEHSVAVRRDGTAAAWGRNDEHQCNVGGWTGIVEAAAGTYHTIGLKSDGTVVAVGCYDYFYANGFTPTPDEQLTRGQCEVPAVLTNPATANVVSIAAADTYSAALRSDGSVIVWGKLYNGSAVPWALNAGSTAKTITSNLALRADGQVVNWMTGLPLSGATGIRTLGGAFGVTTAGTLLGSPGYIAGQAAYNPLPSMTNAVNAATGYGFGLAFNQTIAPVAFGFAGSGAPVQRTITVRNTGTAPLTLSSALSGPGAASFSLTGGTGTIPPGGSSVIDVSFSPAGGGLQAATLRLTSNDVDEATCDIPLSGTGNTPPAVSVNNTGTGVPVFSTLASLVSGGTGNQGGIMQASDGNFYGTSGTGGTGGVGYFFRMTPAGVVTVLSHFDVATTAAFPFTALTEGADGNLYGSTLSGLGGVGGGSIYRVTKAGVITTLASGKRIVGRPLRASDNQLYGVTAGGGTQGYGEFVRIEPAGTITSIASVTYVPGDSDSTSRGDLLEAPDGHFYYNSLGGTRGAINRFTKAGVLSRVVTFPTTDNINPIGPLVVGQDGALYGTGFGGGAAGVGTIFKVTLAGALTKVAEFPGAPGPSNGQAGGLVQGADGTFYGVCYDGGTAGKGTVYSVTTAGVMTKLVDFTGPNGANPDRQSLLLAADGNLYGTTRLGGTADGGTIFKLTFPPPSGVEGQTLSRSGKFSDPEGAATVTITASSGTVTQDNVAGTWQWSGSVLDGPGTNTITLTATDTSGGVSTTTFELLATNAPPVASVSGPANAARGAAVNFNLGATDPGAGDQAAGFAWSVDFGDGSTASVPAGTASPAVRSHAYSANGTFTVTVTATDKDGAVSAPATTTISVANVNEPPSFTMPTSGAPAGPWTVSTFAGSPGQTGSANGTGSAARFNLPYQVGTDFDGNIFVGDTWNHTVRRITPDGVVSLAAGGVGQSGLVNANGASARFYFPANLVNDWSGSMMVSDSSNHNIRRVTANGEVSTFTGGNGVAGSADGDAATARFNYPNGLIRDEAGFYFLADSGNHAIRRIAPDGSVTTIAGLKGTSGSADGTGTDARFNLPLGLAWAGDGTMLVTDWQNSTIRRVTKTGVVTTVAGSAGSATTLDGTGTAARFNLPYGIATDAAGTAYITETGGHCIRRMTFARVVTTLAGAPGQQGSADGSAGAARFRTPHGIAMDYRGQLYVADKDNSTIRKLTPAVTTTRGIEVNVTAGAQSFPFLSSIAPGPAAESAQTVTFLVTNNNHALFSVQPAINSDGILSFTPLAGSPGGIATVSVIAQDNGGTANGGSNTSAPQTFTIRILPPPAIPATYTTGAEIPVTAAGYNAAGKAIAITLNYAPAPGTTLTVVKNTGSGFIQGEFNGLTNGGTVTLPYNGGLYPFIAWYYGGDGNDLVLLWPKTGLATWGSNSFGQIGDNSSAAFRPAPVDTLLTGALSGKTIVDVARGSEHTVVLTSEGRVYCWGGNGTGQLGNGTFSDGTPPAAVRVPAPVITAAGALSGKFVIAIAAGHKHTLALCSDGTVAAWGWNGWGQLGNGTAGVVNNSALPAAVDRSGVLAGKTVTAISAGETHSMALCSDGTLAVWGGGLYGQLGTGSTGNQSRPALVDRSGSSALAGKTVTAISAAYYHSMVLCSDGTIATFGRSSNGLLGHGSMDAATFSTPIAVSAAAGLSALHGRTPVAIAGGIGHSMALCSDGTIVTWGSNAAGSLGDGTTTDSAYAVAVNAAAGSALAGKTVVSIHAGSGAGYARCSDGTLAAWGINGGGQLGDNTNTNRPLPVAVNTDAGISALASRSVIRGGVSSHNAGHFAAIYALPIDAASPARAAMNTWATTAGLTGTAAAPLAEPFGDGVPNLLKFAFNMNATAPDSGSLTPGGNRGLPAFTASPTTFRVEFIRRRNSGLIYTPLRCTSLSTCTPMTGTPVVTVIDANWERVVVEEPLGSPAPTGGFSRVSVSIP